MHVNTVAFCGCGICEQGLYSILKMLNFQAHYLIFMSEPI